MTELILKAAYFKDIPNGKDFKDLDGHWWTKETSSDCNFKHNVCTSQYPWNEYKWFEANTRVLKIVGSMP